ncbi:MAG: energy transducer TonB [Bacteroidales bacterium]|nr:energy transducer TonB [Bacteroidales bacterium]
MVSKKSDNANLEKKRLLFFEIGLALSLALALVVFEWATKERSNDFISYNQNGSILEEFDVQIIRLEKKPPPKLKNPEFKIINNEADIEEENFDIKFDVGLLEGIELYLYDLEEEKSVKDSVIYIAEEMPRYNNGSLLEFKNYIQNVVKYPKPAIENGIEGTVYVQFVVNKKGYITQVNILRSPNKVLDNAVLSAIETSEKWTPGMQNGHPVNVAMSMPVSFRIH